MEFNFLNKKKKDFFKGKRVFLRAGINVPLENNRVGNDFRLRAIIPTLEFLLEAEARIVIAGHIGRDRDNSLEVVFRWFEKEFKKRKVKIFFNSNTFRNDENLNMVEMGINNLKNGEILFLDNLRSNPGEIANSDELAKKIFSNFNIYLNEAFSVSHRKHMSTDALPRLFKKENRFYGLRYQEELENLEKIKNPKTYQKKIFVLGGAKIATKIPMIKKLLSKFDLILLGGAVANNFYLEMGYPVGNSFYDEDFVFEQNELKNIMESGKVFLPEIVITENGERKISKILPQDKILDISPKSFKKIEKDLKESDFVFFNGPMGYYEGGYDNGTRYLLNILANSNNFFVAGGGDTASVIFELGLEKNVDFISTGGGALIKKISE